MTDIWQFTNLSYKIPSIYKSKLNSIWIYHTWGMLIFLKFCKIFCERQILWILCSVVFHSLTLRLPIQNSISVAPKLQVCASSGKKCQNFSKTSTPLADSVGSLTHVGKN